MTCAALIVLGVAGGFWLLGSPDKQRRIVEDENSVADLRAVAMRLQTGTPDDALPARLKPNVDIRQPDGRRVPVEKYRYRRIDSRHFELCATFLEASVPGESEWVFAHGAGLVCYGFMTGNFGGTPYGLSR